MASSTIPAFKASLVALLEAVPALADVQVTYGIPREQPSREWIWIGHAATWQQAAASIGTQSREETYALGLHISVLVDRSTPQQTVTERAFALAALVENAIRAWGARGSADPFGHSVSGARTVEVLGDGYLENVSDKSRECFLSLAIQVRARI